MAALISAMSHVGRAQVTETNLAPFILDLPTVLRLAGAQNLDVQIARQQLQEAQANRTSATWQFFPWLAPGISYRRHDHLIQDVVGNLTEVHKEAYAPGATVTAQVDVGEAVFKLLQNKQLVKAAGEAVESQRQEVVLAAARDYFNLALAQALEGVAREAVIISSNQTEQVSQAVLAELAFKGDQLRAEVQTGRNRLALRQRREEQRLAASRLAQTLRLDPAVELVANHAELLVLPLMETNAGLIRLVAEGLQTRPELRQNQALVAAAREARKGASYGPLIPRFEAQTFLGGLGGGRDDGHSTFGGQQDYFVSMSWRIGPGGLLDSGRLRARQAQLDVVSLQGSKLEDQVRREVVDGFTRWHSVRDQIEIAERALRSAEEGLRLTAARKSFAVGAVLENIQAEQDLTLARRDYLQAIADFNIAQYALLRATGRLH